MPRLLLPVLAVTGCAAPEDRPASWRYLHAAIVEPACATAGCHSALAAQGGLDLSRPAEARAILTGAVCDASPDGDAPGNWVFPGEPARSRLLHLLRATDANLRMPPDAPLADEEIALFERWILEGAPCE